MSTPQARSASHPAPPASFGARLRQERERRKISIASIAESTKILGALLEGLENDDVSRWPTGLYRRAFMRAYARAIGLDAEAVVKEFVETFPEPEDCPAPVPATPPPAPAPSSAPKATAPKSPSSAVRVSAPIAGGWFADGVLVSGWRLRAFAVGVDLFAICVLGVLLFAVMGQFWAPLCLATALYYAGSILVLGNTPGVCLFADPQKRGRVYLNFLRPENARDVADSTV